MNTETETIDKLFLELSQFTKAKTDREMRYTAALKAILEFPHQTDGTTEMHMRLLAKESLKE